MIRIFSVGIRSIPYLEVFLESTVGFGLASESRETVDAVAGWGLRNSAKKAMRYARKMKLPYLALEDGFLRSVGLGHKEPPLSIVVDDLGVYYDATRPSRLESLVVEHLEEPQIQRARKLMAQWRDGRVSKYNHLRESTLIRQTALSVRASDNTNVSGSVTTSKRFVLVVDQTKGDASIRYGLGGPSSFRRMLQAALDENPEGNVLLKVHPDVWAGKKRGFFDVAEVSRIPRVKVIGEDVHPVALIEQADAVYTVTSQLGFEALLWGKPVRTFGMPFYAGWGLTDDELPSPRRRTHATLEQLVYATLIAYPRYVDPETGKGCAVEKVLAYLAMQRRMRERFSPHVYAVGFSAYKRRAVRRYFEGSTVHFASASREPVTGKTVAVWGCSEKVESSGADSFDSTAKAANVIHLEDGFLRSVGLGADLVRPLSWVMDRRGIYYDATRPSDLEHLLQHGEFDTALCTRAALLRSRIVAHGLTKYNVGTGHWQHPFMDAVSHRGECGAGAERKVILVPGQVEKDASIRYGASSIRSNMELLFEVRKNNPDAYIVYKPHPDVVSGLRAGGKRETEASLWCNEIVEDISMHELLGQVDEVHVLTSLTGFEALLRGKPVTTYGQPFYAGWGLTHDLALTPEVIERRTRRLHLDELVAAVLLLYPTYVSRSTGRFTTPEHALDELLAWRNSSADTIPLWRWPLRWVLRIWGSRR